MLFQIEYVIENMVEDDFIFWIILLGGGDGNKGEVNPCGAGSRIFLKRGGRTLAARKKKAEEQDRNSVCSEVTPSGGLNLPLFFSLGLEKQIYLGYNIKGSYLWLQLMFFNYSSFFRENCLTHAALTASALGELDYIVSKRSVEFPTAGTWGPGSTLAWGESRELQLVAASSGEDALGRSSCQAEASGVGMK